MLSLKLLRSLLNADDNEIQGLTVDQLRLLLGVLRFRVRLLEREINRKSGLANRPAVK